MLMDQRVSRPLARRAPRFAKALAGLEAAGWGLRAFLAAGWRAGAKAKPPPLPPRKPRAAISVSNWAGARPRLFTNAGSGRKLLPPARASSRWAWSRRAVRSA